MLAENLFDKKVKLEIRHVTHNWWMPLSHNPSLPTPILWRLHTTIIMTYLSHKHFRTNSNTKTYSQLSSSPLLTSPSNLDSSVHVNCCCFFFSVLQQSYNKIYNLWSFGCISFQMILNEKEWIRMNENCWGYNNSQMN